MDIKQIKADVAAATRQLDEKQQVYVAECVAQSQDMLQRLKPLDQQNRQLSKQIGQAKKQGEDISALLEQKKVLSAQVETLQAQIDAMDKTILACFVPVTADNDEFAAEISRYRWPAMRSISVHQLTAETAAQWDAYVNDHPAANIYHKSCWRSVIEEAFGHQTHYLYARDADGRVCGVLPMIRLTSRLFGDFVVSIPFFNYGGALGEHADVEAALMERAAQDVGAWGAKHIEWRDDFARPGLPVRDDKVAMLRALPSTADELWQQLGTKLRAQIKKPQRENPTIAIGGAELLNDFYAVFAVNMRDLGTPVYAKSFFATILRHMPESARIVIVRHQGKPVSAAFLLGHRETMEIPWASTVREANPLSMNMLLYWEVLCYCIKQGYKRFDFGRSTRDAGTYKFKEQWGAQPKQLYWHYWLANGQSLPKLNPDNPKFKLAIMVWQRLPLWVANTLGPHLVKFLP